MRQRPRIAALICPNGLGHYRRSIGILHRWLQQRDDLEIAVICAKSQIERSVWWPRSREFWAAPNTHHIDNVMPTMSWPFNTDDIEIDWPARLRDIATVRDATLVLSDNFAGVLHVRSDAILLGSFLWSDVLEAADPVIAGVGHFVEDERELLARFRPPMLCVGDMAMPGVIRRTDAVRLPWMFEAPTAPPPPRSTSVPRVAVVGGATGAADEALRRAVNALAGGPWEVASAPHLGAGASFGFSGADYAASDVVVCRPGMGTLNDCVSQRVPIVTLSEDLSNPELAHNGARIAELGLGVDLGRAPATTEIVDAVRRVLEPEHNAAIHKALGRIAGNGLEEAVVYLQGRLDRLGASV